MTVIYLKDRRPREESVEIASRLSRRRIEAIYAHTGLGVPVEPPAADVLVLDFRRAAYPTVR